MIPYDTFAKRVPQKQTRAILEASMSSTCKPAFNADSSSTFATQADSQASASISNLSDCQVIWTDPAWAASMKINRQSVANYAELKDARRV